MSCDNICNKMGTYRNWNGRSIGDYAGRMADKYRKFSECRINVRIYVMIYTVLRCLVTPAIPISRIGIYEYVEDNT